MIRTTFTAVGAQVVAFALATSTVSDPARGPGSYPSASAYFLTFAWITVSSLLMVLATFALPRRRNDEAVNVSAANAATN